MLFREHFSFGPNYKEDTAMIEIDLTKEEKENFDNSIKAVQALFDAAVKIDPELKS